MGEMTELRNKITVLQKARKILAQGWTRKQYWGRRKSGYHGYCFCSLGALRIAEAELHNEVDWGLRELPGSLNGVNFYNVPFAARDLSETIDGKWGRQSIPSFNDTYEKKDVLSAFDLTIERLKKRLKEEVPTP